jgi:hypothetical protein
MVRRPTLFTVNISGDGMTGADNSVSGKEGWVLLSVRAFTLKAQAGTLSQSYE